METCYKLEIEPRVFQILSQRVARTEEEDEIDLEIESGAEGEEMEENDMHEPEFESRNEERMVDHYYAPATCRLSVFLLQNTGELSEWHKSQYQDLDPTFKDCAPEEQNRYLYIELKHPIIPSSSYWFRPDRDVIWNGLLIDPEDTQMMSMQYGGQLNRVERVLYEANE